MTAKTGTDCIPYPRDKSVSSSMSTFANETFPSFSLIMDSILGVNILQGLHQVAKKSTTIGVLLFKTLSSKSFSSLRFQKEWNVKASF